MVFGKIIFTALSINLMTVMLYQHCGENKDTGTFTQFCKQSMFMHVKWKYTSTMFITMKFIVVYQLMSVFDSE